MLIYKYIIILDVSIMMINNIVNIMMINNIFLYRPIITEDMFNEMTY